MSLLRLSRRTAFVGVLSVVVQLWGCSLAGVNPPTERHERLGLSSWTLPPLSPAKATAASGSLLPGVTIEEVEPGEFLLSILLDGRQTEDSPIVATWTLDTLADRGPPGDGPRPPAIEPVTVVTDGAEPTASVHARVVGSGDWQGSVELSRKGRKLATLAFRRPLVPRPGSWPRLREVSRIPLDMAACKDERFPWQIGDFHVGCSPTNGSALLDRKVNIASGRSFPFSVEHRNEHSGTSTFLRPHDVHLGTDSTEGLLWQTPTSLGWWPTAGRGELRLPRAASRGRPARSMERFAFARPDRIEVGEVANGTRSLIHAQPADGTDILAVEGPWLVHVDTRGGLERLVLRNLTRGRQAVVPSHGAPSRPLLLGSWLLWEDEAGVHGLPLEGGRSWSIPLRTDHSLVPTQIDDWILLREQADTTSGLVALHIPSGQVHRPEVGGDRHRVEARGAGAGYLTLWERVAPPSGQMTLFAMDEREFDPRGTGAEGDPLYDLPPGADPLPSIPSAAWLLPGSERSLRIDPGFDANLVEAWVARGDRPVSIDMSQNELLLARTENLPPPQDGAEGHWVPLGVLPATPRGSAKDRAVTLRWFAATEPGTVCRLRLRRLQERL